LFAGTDEDLRAELIGLKDEMGGPVIPPPAETLDAG
jgi:hypothetical protein